MVKNHLMILPSWDPTRQSEGETLYDAHLCEADVCWPCWVGAARERAFNLGVRTLRYRIGTKSKKLFVSVPHLVE